MSEMSDRHSVGATNYLGTRPRAFFEVGRLFMAEQTTEVGRNTHPEIGKWEPFGKPYDLRPQIAFEV